MKFKKFSLDYKLLGVMPDHERQFFIVAGHIFNECSMLQKTMYWSSTPYDEIDEPKEENVARALQAFMLGKVLAAKLYEAHRVLRRSYYGSDLCRKHDDILSDKAKDALRSFNKYFKTSTNLIRKVRMNFASHYSEEEFENKWREESITGKQESLIGIGEHESLIGPSLGNRFYYGSE
ncbi:MAG: hypothetical protein AAF446_08185, partial [Pseudomonadota bacterium]